MRYRIGLFALLTILNTAGCSSRPDLGIAQKFQDAEKAFSTAASQEEFAQVAVQYEQLRAQDFVSGVAFYNQGNAWMRAGETGRAIAAWRQSQRYRPRDPYLRANLQSALTACQSKAPVIPDIGVAGYVLFWQNWLSYPEKFRLATLLLIAVCAVGLSGPLVIQTHIVRRLVLMFGLLFAVAAVSATWDWHRYQHTTQGVVVQGDVEARKGNSESYETAFTKPLHQGSEFVLLEERADWSHIRIPDLGTAWILSRAAVTY